MSSVYKYPRRLCSSVYSNHKKPKSYFIVFGGYGDVVALLKYRWALSALIAWSSGPTLNSPAQNQVLNFEVTINKLTCTLNWPEGIRTVANLWAICPCHIE